MQPGPAMSYSALDFAGNVGVAIIVGAYLLLQIGRIRAQAPAFSAANAAGALLVLASLAEKFNLSAFVMEGFWLLISLAGLWRSLRVRG
ncbi:MAG: hypothetical protein AB7Q97_08670 [Gammaproteobacteria bacterium]